MALYLSPFTQKLSFLYHRQSLYQTWLSSTLSVLTRRVSLVKQELLTLPEHPSSPPGFSGVRVTRSLVLYVCFVDRCLSICAFSFGHCVVCSFSIYRFWLTLWYLQTLLTNWLTPTKYPYLKWHCIFLLLHRHCISSIPDKAFIRLDWFFMLNATFSNVSAISWRPVLVVEEAGVPERTTDHGQATG
jgi:hypothetical protein